MIDAVSEAANCQMDCCRSLAEWSAYGLRAGRPYRTRDPVVGFGFSARQGVVPCGAWGCRCLLAALGP